MKIKTITVVILFGLWTAFTLGGSVWGFIFQAGQNSVSRISVFSSPYNPLHLFVAISIYLCGGGLWGLGIARSMSVEAKPLMKACALSWVSTGLTVAVALGLSLGLIGGIIQTLPHCCHSTHYLFLSIFVPLIGIVTAINAYVVMDTLGYKELRKSVGLKTGVAATLGFLIVGLILLYGFGWEVGNPVPGKYAMLKIALFCSIGAALMGGMAMGWGLREIKNRLASS